MDLKVYCGNNANYKGIAEGTHRVGTRAECIRIGIGVGKNTIFPDYSYDDAYAPIDNRRVYCGNAAVLPAGYNYMGNNSMCLQKGVGIGKMQRYRMGVNVMKLGVYTFSFVGLSGLVFVLLTSRYKDEKGKVNYSKVLPIYILVNVILLLGLYVYRTL